MIIACNILVIPHTKCAGSSWLPGRVSWLVAGDFDQSVAESPRYFFGWMLWFTHVVSPCRFLENPIAGFLS